MCQVAINIPEAVLFDKCLTQVKAEQMAKKAVALYCHLFSFHLCETFIKQYCFWYIYGYLAHGTPLLIKQSTFVK